ARLRRSRSRLIRARPSRRRATAPTTPRPASAARDRQRQLDVAAPRVHGRPRLERAPRRRASWAACRNQTAPTIPSLPTATIGHGIGSMSAAATTGPMAAPRIHRRPEPNELLSGARRGLQAGTRLQQRYQRTDGDDRFDLEGLPVNEAKARWRFDWPSD